MLVSHVSLVGNRLDETFPLAILALAYFDLARRYFRTHGQQPKSRTFNDDSKVL